MNGQVGAHITRAFSDHGESTRSLVNEIFLKESSIAPFGSMWAGKSPLDNGKPSASWGRKATGLIEAAGFPKETLMTIAKHSTATRFQLSPSAQSAPDAHEARGPVARIIISSVARTMGVHVASLTSDRLAPTRDLTRGRSTGAAYG